MRGNATSAKSFLCLKSMKNTFRISDRIPNEPRAQRQPFQQLGRFETQHNLLRSIPSTFSEWIQKFNSSLPLF
eukprot:m.466736 g.466736  ORF g.466736 m.466736 type:complete len:73 (+) comp57062_c0_seq5:379-597(+)